MLFIEVTDSGKEAADFRREVPRKRGRLDKGFFDVECIVVLECQGEIAVERLIDIGLEIDLALANAETARRRARCVTEGKARRTPRVGIETGSHPSSVEHRADRRVEGSGTRLSVATARRRGWRGRGL